MRARRSRDPPRTLSRPAAAAGPHAGRHQIHPTADGSSVQVERAPAGQAGRRAGGARKTKPSAQRQRRKTRSPPPPLPPSLSPLSWGPHFLPTLPIRMAAGVTSTNSESSMYSTASSSVIGVGGERFVFSSAPAERMFVSCFWRQTLTLRSPARWWMPTIWFSYTSSPGAAKSEPRSCAFFRPCPVAVPFSCESKLPRSRLSKSPAHGLYPAKVVVMTASPRVADMSLVLTPAMARDGTSYCSDTMPSGETDPISSMLPFRSPSIEMTEPEYSSGSSTSTSSNGSHLAPSISCSITFGQPIISSKPSRRIVSISTVRWSSPRPYTWNESASPVSLSCSATFVSSSFSSLSRMFREVSSLPALPAKGDLFTPIEMDMVGSSTEIGSSGRGSAGSTRVSPMLNSLSPEKTTMSPADASSTALRPIASKTNSSEIFALFTGSPGPAERPSGWPLATRPARTRPMPSRPMNGSDPMFEIWSCSEPAVSAAGAGRSRIFLSRGSMLSETSSGSSPDCRLIAEVYTIGKSVCSSEAPSSTKRSNVLSMT
mmetsp:Transcript_9238/g.27198  ORF Transcript_9238/g.27198 Transcript_9238/m.27198 type:complete len:543 (+) Transcript_9238:86-1714(+)